MTEPKARPAIKGDGVGPSCRIGDLTDIEELIDLCRRPMAIPSRDSLVTLKQFLGL